MMVSFSKSMIRAVIDCVLESMPRNLLMKNTLVNLNSFPTAFHQTKILAQLFKNAKS